MKFSLLPIGIIRRSFIEDYGVYSNSILKVMALDLEVRQNKIDISTFNLLQIKTIIPRGTVTDSFSRYIDISYYDHKWNDRYFIERVIDFGGGSTVKVTDQLVFSVMPVLGFQYLEKTSNITGKLISDLIFNYKKFSLVNTYTLYSGDEYSLVNSNVLETRYIVDDDVFTTLRILNSTKINSLEFGFNISF